MAKVMIMNKSQRKFQVADSEGKSVDFPPGSRAYFSKEKADEMTKAYPGELVSEESAVQDFAGPADDLSGEKTETKETTKDETKTSGRGRKSDADKAAEKAKLELETKLAEIAPKYDADSYDELEGGIIVLKKGEEEVGRGTLEELETKAQIA